MLVVATHSQDEVLCDSSCRYRTFRTMHPSQSLKSVISPCPPITFLPPPLPSTQPTQRPLSSHPPYLTSYPPLTACSRLSAQVKLPLGLVPLRFPLIGDFAAQNCLIAERTLEAGTPYVMDIDDAEIYRQVCEASLLKY